MEAIFNFFNQNTQTLSLYIPLGIIGLWRWSVWVIRKIISLFYHEPKGNYPATLSIITPVYNEDSEMFKMALKSWALNDPDEIIAVIDYTNKNLIDIFKEFSQRFSGAKLIVTKKSGKRSALADGVRASKSEIVALVDSDTIWDKNIKNKLLGVFADKKVGGLVTRQDVLKPKTLSQKLLKILLDDRYLLEYPFLATVSDAMLCLSGRTAVYRKTAIMGELVKLENETFWGKKMISGDDKTLTNLVHASGWQTRYVKSAKVYTRGILDIFSFLKQKVRWTRNGLRSDSKVLLSKWFWKKHPILALHMLDKLVPPITLLIGLSYFVSSLYFGHWQFALIIGLWWLVSRFIKIFPHIREKPADIFILPAYIIITFIIAAIKIYALLTLDKQGWITRWDKKRLGKFKLLESIFTYTATFSVIFGIFFLVFSYKNNLIAANQLPQPRLSQKSAPIAFSIFTKDKPRPSNSELEKTKNTLQFENQSDPFGYYTVKENETLPLLRKRFNLNGNGRILNAQSKAPLEAFSSISAGQQIAIPVQDLRNPLTIATLNNFSAKPPVINFDVATNTIFVKQGGSVATLAKINQALSIGNKNLLEEISPKEWILRANLYIGKDVTLILDKNEVEYLKLKSNANDIVWLRSETGSILISKTKITSWDENNATPDFNDKDGRSYITAKNSGRMDIIDSELAYLGYIGAPKRGGAFGGSYGVSWKIKNNGIRDRLLTGVVKGNKFHNNYFGAYTFGATGMLFAKNEFYDNVEYGLDPHDDSNNLIIEDNSAFHNGNHGIIISRRCVNNIIRNNTSFENRLHGIMLDRSSNNNLVLGNTVYGNVDGITLYESNRNLILENNIHNNVRGIRLTFGSTENYFEKNAILQNSRGAYLYDRAQKNILVNNIIKDNEIGITLKNAQQNILINNFKPSENTKDGRVTDNSYENNIQ